VIYKFREGYSLPVKAQIVGDHLAKLNGFGAEQIVEEASSEDSPLHPCFEWDDSEAAQKYRIEQARYLIRSIEEVTISERGVETRQIAYVSVSERNTGSSYMNTTAAMSNERTAAIVIAEAKAALAGWSRRYRHLAAIAKEFGPILHAIDQLDEKLPKDGKAKTDNRKRKTAHERPAQQIA
jgi:hypothetical protein